MYQNEEFHMIVNSMFNRIHVLNILILIFKICKSNMHNLMAQSVNHSVPFCTVHGATRV